MNRAVAGVATAILGLAVVYVAAQLLGVPDPDWAYLPRGVIHLSELAVLVALALGGVAGRGALGRIGLAAAAVGTVVLAVAEVVTVAAPGVSEALFSVAPPLVGLGVVLAGIAVARAGVWTGPRRYLVLALGIYVFAVLTPLLIVSGGPPATPALWGLLGWELLWFAVAVAVLPDRERVPA